MSGYPYIYDPDAVPCEVNHKAVSRLASRHGDESAECPWCGIAIGIACDPGIEADLNWGVEVEVRATEIDLDGMIFTDWNVGEMYGWGAFTMDIDVPESQISDGWERSDWHSGWLASSMSLHGDLITPARCTSTHYLSMLPLSYGPTQCELNEGHLDGHRSLEYDTWWSTPVAAAPIVKVDKVDDFNNFLNSVCVEDLRKAIDDIASSAKSARHALDSIIRCK